MLHTPAPPLDTQGWSDCSCVSVSRPVSLSSCLSLVLSLSRPVSLCSVSVRPLSLICLSFLARALSLSSEAEGAASKRAAAAAAATEAQGAGEGAGDFCGSEEAAVKIGDYYYRSEIVEL